MKELLFIGSIALVISVAIEIVYFKKGQPTLLKIIFRTFIIWLVTTLIPFLALNAWRTNNILNKIYASEKYNDAKNIIEGKTSSYEKDLFKIGWKEINSRLDGIVNDDMIYIDRKDIKKIWKEIFSKTQSGYEVWATNCVIPSEWRNFDMVKELVIDTQKEAIKRKIKIRRVHLIDYSEKNHVDGQLYIDSVLTHQLDSNYYESKIMSIKRFNSAINNKYDLRFKDIGISNVGSEDEILFITDISDNYSINGAWITTDKTKIEEAKKFYMELWNGLD